MEMAVDVWHDAHRLLAASAAPVQCQEMPPWGFVVGVLMGVVGSIGINIGQNLQAAGIMQMPEDGKPLQSRLWLIGLAVFIGFSLVNFAAFALAPASILTPLESIQFVTNVFYNKFVNRVHITRRMYFGVGLACVGTVFTVVFGASSDGCHSISQLEGFWRCVQAGLGHPMSVARRPPAAPRPLVAWPLRSLAGNGRGGCTSAAAWWLPSAPLPRTAFTRAGHSGRDRWLTAASSCR